MTSATARGLVIAAPRSGSGKTTVTLGLLRALRNQGLGVGSAKCGPDYIDPAFHARATGRPSINLDTWAMTPERVAALARTAGAGCEIVVAEGLMGLFDGVPADPGGTGSTADVAAATGWPVVLVHDVSGQAQSAAAQIAGCLRFDARLRFAGVILNRVGSERHQRLVTTALAPFGVPVLGNLPKNNDLVLPERHLGLVQASETADLEGRLETMAAFVGQHVDVRALLEHAAAGSDTAAGPDLGPAVPPLGQHIAVAKDAAFSFIYPHVLDGWKAAGVSVRFFSPLADEAPPEDCDACWLPGGYPELHGPRLAAAHAFRTGLRRFAETRPVHGECGGYMALGESLVDAQGVTHSMTGLLSVRTSFAKRSLNLGYRDAELLVDSPLGAKGSRLRGHEFHYATIVDRGADEPLARVSDAYGHAPIASGSRRGRVTGSFFHALAAVPCCEPKSGAL